MSFLKIVKTKLFLALTLVSLGLLAGCTGDSNVTASTTQVNKLVPTGIIQGRLVDACTQQPIANAIIDIGVAKAVTKPDGQYVLRNVPGSLQDDGRCIGDYSATIDLREAKNASGESIASKYAAFAYNELSVVFEITSTHGDGGVITTVITGVAGGDQDIVVGKNATALKGKVLLPPANSWTASLPAPGYFVKLIATKHHNNDDQSDKDNGGTGSTNTTTGLDDNVVATTTTDASGNYVFANVESQRKFKVIITDTDTTKTTSAKPTFTAYVDACGGCDGIVTFLDTVTVCIPPVAPPCLIGNTPAQNDNVFANPDGTTSIAVTFTFNKAIEGNSNNGALASSATNDPINTLALTSAGNKNSLYASVDVNLKGYKDSNIAHSLSWNAARTVLTVTIPNAAPAAIYSVEINKALGHWRCGYDKDTDPQYGDHDTNILGGADICAGSACVTFYTFGASTAAAPKLRALNTPYDYDGNEGYINLSWLPSSQAKAYNIYCQPVQNWGQTQEKGAWKLVDSSILSVYNFNPSIPTYDHSLFLQDLTYVFVENWKIKMTWNCKVRGVNADGTEGPDAADKSNEVDNIADTVNPKIVDFGSTTLGPEKGGNVVSHNNYINDIKDGDNHFQICFNEPMDKASAETVANYTVGAYSGVLTVTNAVYDVPSRCVDLTFSGNVNASLVTRANISTGADGINDTTRNLQDGLLIPTGSGGACVSPVSTDASDTTGATLSTTNNPDDVLFKPENMPAAMTNWIFSGANDTCDQSPVPAGDTQIVAPTVKPGANQVAITANTFSGSGAVNNNFVDFVLTSVIPNGKDDNYNRFDFITIGSGVTDVAGNALKSGFTKITTDGVIR